MIATACLVPTALCVLTAFSLLALSARRRDGFFGLAALAVMVVGAIPAVAYGGITS